MQFILFNTFKFPDIRIQIIYDKKTGNNTTKLLLIYGFPIVPILLTYGQKKTSIFRLRFNKYGSYLLSQLDASTIGHGGLNFSVRNGKR